MPILALVFLGGGCTTITTPGHEAAVGDASEFRGLDGSLTEFAFDEVATAYIDWLLTEPVTEQPTADDFDLWLSAEVSIPVSDTFANPVKLTSDAPRMFTLWTEGEDGEPNTEDDYFKGYQY